MRNLFCEYEFICHKQFMYDVAIIGGGAAGMMAAKILSGAGKKILLLEARDHLGGRIHSVANFSFTAEGGAEFIHGNLQTTFDLLKEAGLKKAKIKGDFCRVTSGRWTKEDNIVPYWNLLIKKLNACNENITVEKFLTEFFYQKKYENLRKQFKKYVEGYDAADTGKASVLAIKKEMEHEEQDQYRPVKGYYALIEFLKKSCLKKDVTIKFKEPVTQIKIKRSIEIITTYERYVSEKLIIAVPLAILQTNKNTAGYIDLPETLNSYIKAARKIGNGGVIKFLLEFDSAFWLDKAFLKEKKVHPPSYFFADTIIPTWWTQHPSKTPLLTGWVGGPTSFKMKNYSQKKFKSLLLESLSSIFSLPASELEKRLVNYKVINWIKEPYIRGGYSYATVRTKKAREFIGQPFKNSIYFAGEYLPGNSASTVNDALQSGIEAAGQILKL